MSGVLFDTPAAGVRPAVLLRRQVSAAIIGRYLHPGDTITVPGLAAQSALPDDVVAPVLERLTDEGFLTRHVDRFHVAIITREQGLHAVETLRLIAAAITPTDSASGLVLLDYIAAITGTARTEQTGMFRAAREAFARAAAECINPTLAKTLTSGVDGLLWRASHAPAPGQVDDSGDVAAVGGSLW